VLKLFFQLLHSVLKVTCIWSKQHNPLSDLKYMKYECIFSPPLLGQPALVRDNLRLFLEFFFPVVDFELHESTLRFCTVSSNPKSFSKQLSTCSIVRSSTVCLNKKIIRRSIISMYQYTMEGLELNK
jgi:hypothetical protein